MDSSTKILPGATLGVMGGGQLGRMFAMAAAQMGYRTIVYAPEADCPASQVCWLHIEAGYDDKKQLKRFAQLCSGVTIEFENVPVEALKIVEQYTCVRPGPKTLAVCQDRLNERAFLDQHNLPTAAHRSASSLNELDKAVGELGVPLIAKSSQMGYDGRGQDTIEAPDQSAQAWNKINADSLLCEQVVDFVCEISVLVARNLDGTIQTFGPIENQHKNHILDFSISPARVDTHIANQARDLAIKIAKALELQGLICVEMFVTKKGSLVINELAPRPHNSGHLTIEGATVSQFHQQVRALCNLPLGNMQQRKPTVMANLLGHLWENGEPDWSRLLSFDCMHLHLYNKQSPRAGRKMGHITVCAADGDKAYNLAQRARQEL